MAEVESFSLDHTKVQAPYVRKIETQQGPAGGQIVNYDLRLTQPNETAIETAGVHTLEHLFASLVRDELDGIIDISPFGCRTGFHVISWQDYSSTEVAVAFTHALRKIRDDIQWDDVPATTIRECGNFKDHSLHSAKEWARIILDQGFSDDPYVRHVVEA
ncbi:MULTISPECIES: S-ribosylhomocysteine lyase [Weissella]|jgi:S-ribosylhomocysteine lyase|uniref:S-ribosylhomocysteine lyase n=2 Tax=Weissella TaxID=46255 RepID=A0A4Y4G0B5_WEIHE|nr:MULTISPECIES: S-ribosylhomocysteine lyase [Weissella]KAA8434705.1 S-ribosylhomocysteine lyase [Weissella paramesenteroides]KAA8437664.1 S-ribosylhomocysteine lyase [Weissella paramesenteroides]MBU7567369.1 S-ribosylhomocysteine lyase [Weissella hellenica]NKY66190.1 S-ribosylhomocysteine lyase [Weissella hellenica]QDJ59402.1 S-ribosylhomocysteine lyase [Weissella hellenica]